MDAIVDKIYTLVEMTKSKNLLTLEKKFMR